ncbi:MAG TPA: proline--tRNA ligase [Burkholderiales bacterium]|nr:proline--tRNA ligase [Burkholderiales bacterium]
MEKTAITPIRSENYPEWYQQVIVAADLAENSAVRGCMVIKPWGYAIWELIQKDLDRRFKKTGHVNAYFPLLIPLSYLEKEAAHVDGFAKECAVVTHHRLVADGEGGLKPDGELDEPLVIRPTSETIIGESFSKWVKSYRDLPLLINQWANIMRWEMRTRLFLRTSEFLWQEGHTVHATADEAIGETKQMLDVYAAFAQDVLAMPVIKGEKPCFERFPGAVSTYCIEAMMQDCKALQAGTSHFLGQNFAKASGIEFQNKAGELETAWTTSWGVSTRLIGGLIMTHSDDNGLVLPPRIAPQQVVIQPIYRNDEQRASVLAYCQQLKLDLEAQHFAGDEIRVLIDDRDIQGGAKSWEWIKKGVPLRVEIGLRDIEKDVVMLSRRDDLGNKQSTPRVELIANAVALLSQMQDSLFAKAQAFRDSRISEISSLTEFNEFFAAEQNIDSGFVLAYAVDEFTIEEYIKPLKVTARCMPLANNDTPGVCIFTGKPATRKMVFAKAY